MYSPPLPTPPSACVRAIRMLYPSQGTPCADQSWTLSARIWSEKSSKVRACVVVWCLWFVFCVLWFMVYGLWVGVESFHVRDHGFSVFSNYKPALPAARCMPLTLQLASWPSPGPAQVQRSRFGFQRSRFGFQQSRFRVQHSRLIELKHKGLEQLKACLVGA